MAGPGGAVVLSLLHAAVIYTPFLQEAFSTVSLNTGDWLFCAAVSSSVPWLHELGKMMMRGVGKDVVCPLKSDLRDDSPCIATSASVSRAKVVLHIAATAGRALRCTRGSVRGPFPRDGTRLSPRQTRRDMIDLAGFFRKLIWRNESAVQTM